MNNGMKNKENIDKKQKTLNVVLVYLIVLSLLLSALAFSLEHFEKPITTIKGDKGDTGERGEQGLHGLNGTNGVNGSKGDKGDKGEKGDTGSSGSSGRNGIDCKPNQKPVIILIDINGSRIQKCTEFTFWLNLSIIDPENDNMKTTFYYKEKPDDNWMNLKTCFGNNGLYNISKTFYYPFLVLHKTIYFMVEVWDGSDISFNNYEFMV